MVPQVSCLVQAVLDKALMIEPDAEVWFLTEGDRLGLYPVAGVAACRRPGMVCLLGQHPAQRSFELVAELSFEAPHDAVSVLVPRSGALMFFEVRWVELLDNVLDLGGVSCDEDAPRWTGQAAG